MKQKPCAFCTFGNPTSASRALILLNGVDFGPGTLVVKVTPSWLLCPVHDSSSH